MWPQVPPASLSPSPPFCPPLPSALLSRSPPTFLLPARPLPLPPVPRMRRKEPSPTCSPTDPMPAGPRTVTVGRPHTRHLARKLGVPDGQNTPGTHTPPPSPSSACA